MYVWEQAGPVQKTLWWLEALFARLVLAVFGLLPIETASGLGGWIVRRIGPFLPAHKVALKNIDLVFPDMDRAKRQELVITCWDNLGRLLGEFPHLHELHPYTDNSRVEVVGKEHLDKVIESDKAAIIITGHFANWEVMAAAICLGGLPARVSYRAANNPWIDAIITKTRQGYGVPDLSAKGGEGAKEMLDALKDGQTVTFLNDQKFNQGVETEFFGHKVMTAPGPSRLAVRFGLPILPVSVVRLPHARFRVTFHEHILPPQDVPKSEATMSLLAQINGFMEERIRECPESWFWVHRRWPKTVYKRE